MSPVRFGPGFPRVWSVWRGRECVLPDRPLPFLSQLLPRFTLLGNTDFSPRDSTEHSLGWPPSSSSISRSEAKLVPSRKLLQLQHLVQPRSSMSESDSPLNLSPPVRRY
jgi:hypothetical protein